MKIFITGFQRSGTSLLRHLFELHPEVKKMWHETGMLKHGKNALYTAKVLHDPIPLNKKNRKGKLLTSSQFTVNFSLKDETWGEKIPYKSTTIKKGYGGTLISYCKLWNLYFGKEARIVHIIRHPLDVANSTKKIGYSRSIITPIIQYKKIVPIIVNELKTFSNVIHVKYEDLLLNPKKTLNRLFKFCNLGYSDETVDKIINSDNIYWFGKIDKSRAFNYKKKIKEINIKRHKLNEIIPFLNKEIKGIKYD